MRGTEDVENEADFNSVRLLNETNVEEKRHSIHPLENNNAESKEHGKTTFLKRIATSLDLDLLRDRRYIAIALGK